MQGCGAPADGPGPWHLDLRERLAAQAAGLGSRTSPCPPGARPTTATASTATGHPGDATAGWWRILGMRPSAEAHFGVDAGRR